MYLLLAGALLLSPSIQDPRLAPAHPVRELAVSAKVLCTDLGKAWGVPLICDERISDDLVILVSRPRSLAELMTKVAEHFQWTWTPDGDGYRLEPTPIFLQTASNGRAKWILGQQQSLRNLARKRLRELAMVNVSALENEAKSIYQILEEPQKEGLTQKQIEEDDARRAKLVDRVGEIEGLLDPAARIALQATANLTDSQLVSLYDRRLVLSTDPGPLEERLPSQASALFLPWVRKLQDQERKLQQQEQQYVNFGLIPMFQSAPAAQAAVVRVMLTDSENAHVSLMTAQHEIVSDSEIELPAEEEKEPGYGTAPADLKAAITAKYPEEPPSKEWSEPLLPFAHWLDHIADRLKVDLISDAYDDYYPYDPTESDKERASYLDDFEPRVKNGWLVMRSTTWPQEREEFGPRHLLRRLSDPIELMPLDDRAALVSKFNWAQIHSPMVPVQVDDYLFLRAWAVTSPEIKQALAAGKVVPLVSMPPEYLAYLREKDGRQGRQLDSFDWGYGVFGEPEFGGPNLNRPVTTISDIDSESGPQTIPPRPVELDVVFASMYPRFLDAASNVRLRSAVVPGLFDARDRTVMEPMELVHQNPEEEDADYNLEAELAKGELHPASVRGMRFEFRIRGDRGIAYQCEEATFEQRVVTNRSTWPADLLKRIQAHERLREQIRSNIRTGSPPP